MRKSDILAFDRGSVRSKDGEGRLLVEVANISKANVCPYLGREIPNCEDLGLDPDRVYQLLRDPGELEKAAPSFNKLPILLIHKPSVAEDHPREMTVGTTGESAAFEAPYLKNSLAVWDGEGITLIESGEQKQLSCGYRYRADMTPGTYEGEKYDGVMRDIIGNHVSLVQEGRAGPDVVVGDSMENITMPKALLTRKAAMAQGALVAYLGPKLAVDAKIDLNPMLAGVTGKNFKAKKPALLAALAKGVEGKLAKDANIADLAGLLDAIETVPVAESEEAPAKGPVPPPKKEPADPKSEDKSMDADPLAKVKAFLQGKISDEDMAQLDALMAAPAEDEGETPQGPEMNAADPPEPDDGSTQNVGAADDDTEPTDKDKLIMTKPAMDAALAAAVKAATEQATREATRVQREIRDAERAVRPYVGDLAMSFDSAADVYAAALKARGVETKDVHPSAFKVILETLPKAGERPAGSKPVAQAMDAAAAKEYVERFPHANRLKR